MKLRGTKGSAASSPASSSTSAAAGVAICCMCGDRGLMEELIRCRICRVRFQHKYCSNLYPKADLYNTCNWCLKEGGVVQSSGTESSNISRQRNSMVGSSNSSGRGLGMVKLHRSAFASEKPIKKQRVTKRSSSSSSSGMIRKTGSSKTLISSGLGREKHGFRGRVQRYKLLEEVFSY